ncbi:MAG: hypothetical protein IJN50_04645 [Clostridia bacterium]|nr:hypothetical protein [Clostridia bacterium]
MRTIYIIKIVSIILILSTIFSFVPNVSLATNGKEGINLFADIIDKLIVIIKDLALKFSEMFANLSIKDLSIQEPEANTAFADIAKDCKAKISGFNYGDGWVGVPFSEESNSANNPASSNRQSSIIDCSGYVSWALYKYGCGKGSDLYKTIFSEQRGTKQIQLIVEMNPTLFYKVGTLGSCNVQRGDILLKSGHVEIFNKKSGNTYYCYNAGENKDIHDGTGSKGDCNEYTSSYTVYRVIK